MHYVLPEYLYHGSAVSFDRIDVTRGRDRKDFGKGFYMAFSRSQAIGMMNKKYDEAIGIFGKDCGEFEKTLYRIELDSDAIRTLRVKEFAAADIEWFDFVLMCRANRGVPHDFDVVIGPTADDNTNFVLKNFLDGFYGDIFLTTAKEHALSDLEPETLGVQLYSGRQSVIDRIVKRMEKDDWRQP